MSYASGKFAVGLCDRCAFEYPLLDLKKEWTGFKVCNECWEPKHPQLEPHTAPADPQALYEPRPNTDFELGEGYVVVTVSNMYIPSFMNDSIIGTNFTVSEMTGVVGEVTITTS